MFMANGALLDRGRNSNVVYTNRVIRRHTSYSFLRLGQAIAGLVGLQVRFFASTRAIFWVTYRAAQANMPQKKIR